MNPHMRYYLSRAFEERAAGRRGLKKVLQMSFRLGADGFDRRTIWRALELATESIAQNDQPDALYQLQQVCEHDPVPSRYGQVCRICRLAL